MNEMLGFPLSNDRRWEIDTGEFKAVISEYNDEITGFDARLCVLDPAVFHYGGNAYYVLGHYLKSKGWTATELSQAVIASAQKGRE